MTIKIEGPPELSRFSLKAAVLAALKKKPVIIDDTSSGKASVLEADGSRTKVEAPEVELTEKSQPSL